MMSEYYTKVDDSEAKRYKDQAKIRYSEIKEADEN